ncbi:MAG: hypothetical protein ACKOOL_08250 [Novosphingobium sp.]
MRYLIAAAGGLLLAACSQNASAPGAGAAAMDGTYKIDVASAKLSTKPDTFTIKDGEYDCSSCTPPFKIAADGKPHDVAGRDYWDSASVKVVDAKTIEFTRYRKGVSVGSATVTVSDDGQMLTWTSHSSDNAEGKAVTNTSKSKRTAPAPAGAHAVSGSWVGVNDGAQIADESTKATIKFDGKTVSMKLPTGEGYEAKIGGPQVPFTGDKAGATMAVTAEGTGFKEIDYVGGKPVMEFIYTPVDATSATLKVHNVKADTTDEYSMKKQ